MRHLFNQVVGKFKGKPKPDDSGRLMAVAQGVLGAQFGGLAGLVERSRDVGLGDLVDSWVGRGPNRAISAEQVRELFGEERLAALARDAGLDTSRVAVELAGILPQAVDWLTPDGELPGPKPPTSGTRP